MTTLEQIRAEIEQLENPCSKEHGCIAEVLQIIDKYAEQERTKRQSCENCKHNRKECGNDDHYGFCQNWECSEQEPSEDAIDREYLFKVLDDFCGHDRTATIMLDSLADIVYDMPSVRPQEPKTGHWIPVSERLPVSDEEYHTFLVTDNNGKVTLSDFYLSLSDGKPYWSGMLDVIAWMPLPKPYAPQESES